MCEADGTQAPARVERLSALMNMTGHPELSGALISAHATAGPLTCSELGIALHLRKHQLINQILVLALFSECQCLPLLALKIK